MESQWNHIYFNIEFLYHILAIFQCQAQQESEQEIRQLDDERTEHQSKKNNNNKKVFVCMIIFTRQDKVGYDLLGDANEACISFDYGDYSE